MQLHDQIQYLWLAGLTLLVIIAFFWMRASIKARMKMQDAKLDNIGDEVRDMHNDLAGMLEEGRMRRLIRDELGPRRAGKSGRSDSASPSIVQQFAGPVEGAAGTTQSQNVNDHRGPK